jgi:hypothetical protein
VLWTSRDRELEWVRSLDRLPADPPLDPEAEDIHRWRREVAAEHGHHFTNVARTTVAFTRRMRIDDAVNMVATYSRVITADVTYQQAVLGTARATLRAQFGDVDEFDFPMRSWCWRGDRAA